MGYLKNKTCYLAGHIAFLDGSGVSWREEITEKLKVFGVNIKDPTKKSFTAASEIGEDKELFKRLIRERKFEECKERFWPVMRHDLRSVDLSDFLIVNFAPRIPTVGTIDEILVCTRYQKKPCLVYIEENELDYLNPWLLGLLKSNWLFTSWDSMFDYLKQIDSGNIETSHWTL